MKGLKILISIILDLLILILIIGIGIALYGFIQVKVLNKTYSNYFGYTYFQILTGSMEETIKIDPLRNELFFSEFSQIGNLGLRDGIPSSPSVPLIRKMKAGNIPL